MLVLILLLLSVISSSAHASSAAFATELSRASTSSSTYTLLVNFSSDRSNPVALVVSASGSIRLDTYGMIWDGTPPIIQDSFQYTTDTCPYELLFGSEELSFVVEEGASDSKATTLDTSDGTTADFTLTADAAWLSVTPSSGKTPANLTVAVDATGLTPGTYTAVITADAPGYTSAIRQVTLQVTSTSSGSYDLLASTSSSRANPVLLDGLTISGDIYIFTPLTRPTSNVSISISTIPI